MRNRKAFRITFVSLVFLCLWSQHAAAQETGSFDQLPGLVKPGEILIVTSDDGSKVKGRMIEISADRILFRMKKGERSIPASEITRVQHYRNGVLLGALIGGAAGIPFALALNEYAANEGGSPGVAAVPIVLGMGIGIGIDALLKRPRTVYSRTAPARVTASAIVDRNRRGVRVAINF